MCLRSRQVELFHVKQLNSGLRQRDGCAVRAYGRNIRVGDVLPSVRVLELHSVIHRFQCRHADHLLREFHRRSLS